jgi:hypothetical protein
MPDFEVVTLAAWIANAESEPLTTPSSLTRCRHCPARRNPWVQHEWARADTALGGALCEALKATVSGAMSARRRRLNLYALLRMACLQNQSGEIIEDDEAEMAHKRKRGLCLLFT